MISITFNALKKTIFLCIVFALSNSQLYSIDTENAPMQSYQDLIKKMDIMAQDPLIFLDNLKKNINIDQMSCTERELLINQLETLKKTFCNRRMKSYLVLPILPTIILGLKSFAAYKLVKDNTFKNSVLLHSIHENNVHTFAESFFYFLIALAAMIIVELEHDESISSLFVKERKIHKKIDELIASLQCVIDKNTLSE
jgi:uncharacterized membrane protein